MNKKSIFDRNLKITRPDINLSTFNYFISEIMQYYLSNSRNLDDELEKLGENIGPRLLELMVFREKQFKHEIKHVEMLKFIHTSVWKALFGKTADSLEKAKDSDVEYMIKDYNPAYMRYISEYSHYSAASFMVGIIKSILNSAGFESAVTYQTLSYEEKTGERKSLYPQTVWIVEFASNVIQRESFV